METSEVYNTLMNSIDKEIDIVIDNHFTQSCFESYVLGFHVYKTVWSPLIGEENLKCRHEQSNKEDEFAIGVYRNDLEKETYTTQHLQICSKFLEASQFENFLSSQWQEDQQRCWIWFGSTCNIHLLWPRKSHQMDQVKNRAKL